MFGHPVSQGTALDNKREFQDQGIIALRNLKQTMKLAGRRMLPDVHEISAILAGKYTKIQKLYVALCFRASEACVVFCANASRLV